MSKYGKRAVGLLLTGALCAGLLAGCGGAPEAAVTPTAPSESGSASGRRVETLRLEGGTDWGVPNPYLHQSRGPGTAKMRLVYGSLLEKDETGDVHWLAERWSMDGNDYTFTLFADAQFQDGAPLTTADVAFTLDYYQEHPPVSNSLGVGDSYLVDHYTVVDEQTITITVKEANADTLSNLGSFVILPKHIWENVDDPNAYTGEGYLTGSGAYACTDYDGATGSYEFTAFDGWCNGEQAAEKIQFVPVSDPLLAFESGEIDITSLPADLMDAYLNDPSIGVVEKANDMGYDRFNVGPEAEFFLFKTDEEGKPFPDNDERAIFFARGVLETVKKLRWTPTVVHCHGWFSSVIPVYLKRIFADDPIFRNVKIVVSLYGDGFPGELDNAFGKKIAGEGVKDKNLAILDTPSYENLCRFVMEYADGVVAASPDVEPKVLEIARASGKPMLEYQSPEAADFFDNYNRFYEALQ